MNQKIVPCLWFNRGAEAATHFYKGIFKDVEIGKVTRYAENTPDFTGMKPGEVMTLEITLFGHAFTMLNADGHFQFSPATSLTVSCATLDEVSRYYDGLVEGGQVLMPLGSYPFSEKFAFITDRFGLSWQILYPKQLADPAATEIIPTLLFVGEKFGRAERAMKSWVSIFADAKITEATQMPSGELLHGRFLLFGQEFVAMDGAGEHGFDFTGALSLQIFCDDQDEIDRYWRGLLKSGGSEQACGWINDGNGVHWQITPKILNTLLDDPKTSKRVLDAMFRMKKFDISELKKAAASAD